MVMSADGLLTCLRYSLPPNNLSYCGPDETESLLGYRTEETADPGLTHLLSEFSTLYQYLSFIAYENDIRDPFDPRVIEAYWIGNKLLTTITPQQFYQHLTDTQKVKKLLKKKDATKLFDKLNYGALPHHAFHVLNLYRRTGHLPIEHTLETMDACRIGWGEITAIGKNESITVYTSKLIMKNGKLTLSKPSKKTISNQIQQKFLLKNIQIGDWVSYHWHVACDILSTAQVRALQRFTTQAIILANI